MSPIRNVLALDDRDPICAPCTIALGGTNTKVIPVFDRPCRHCGNIRRCAAVGDITWPAALVRPAPRHEGKPWRQPDDYSELETMLGGRREP